MQKCELIQGCFFLTNFSNNMPSQLSIVKRKYCNQDFGECARYMTAKKIGQHKMPLDLDPRDIELADKIISQHAYL